VHPVLAARDIAASIEFFRRLGFELTFQDSPIEPKYAAMRRDGVELHLQWADANQWVSGLDRPVYRFLVDDVDRLFEQFEASGGTDATSPSPWRRPADTPWGTREFHLRDPAMNGLQFYRR
jgi:catechol 2,3-dioxygenase-like lactoylglutathione lyase family enzyme